MVSGCVGFIELFALIVRRSRSQTAGFVCKVSSFFQVLEGRVWSPTVTTSPAFTVRRASRTFGMVVAGQITQQRPWHTLIEQQPHAPRSSSAPVQGPQLPARE